MKSSATNTGMGEGFAPTTPKPNRKKRSQRMLAKYREILRAEGSIGCGICLQPITDIKVLTVDHIFPRVKGGTSRRKNLQPAHRKCNSTKGDQILLPKKNILNYFEALSAESEPQLAHTKVNP